MVSYISRASSAFWHCRHSRRSRRSGRQRAKLLVPSCTLWKAVSGSICEHAVNLSARALPRVACAGSSLAQCWEPGVPRGQQAGGAQRGPNCLDAGSKGAMLASRRGEWQEKAGPSLREKKEDQPHAAPPRPAPPRPALPTPTLPCPAPPPPRLPLVLHFSPPWLLRR